MFMKPLNKLISFLLAGTLIGCFISCKPEIKYVEKTYTENVIFEVQENDSSVTVTMSCKTEDSSIFYTTDGTLPSTESTKYEAPVTITQNTTIYAFSTKEGLEPSPIVSVRISVPKVTVISSTTIPESKYYYVYLYKQNTSGSKILSNYYYYTDYNCYITEGSTLSNIASSLTGFTPKLMTVENNNIHIFYDRNTIEYTFVTKDGSTFEDGSTSKIVSGLYETSVSYPKTPKIDGYYFIGWKDSEDNKVSKTFGAVNKTFYATYEQLNDSIDYSNAEIGDIILENGLFVSANDYNSDTYEAKPVGLVIRKKTDTAPALMIGLNYQMSGKQWCTSKAKAYDQTIEELFSDKLTDGSLAWDIIKKKFDDTNNLDLYPAWKWCLNYGSTYAPDSQFSEDWYIPTISEAQEMIENKSLINTNMSRIGGSNFQNCWFWTCTQSKSNSYTIDGIYPSDNTINNSSKDDSYGYIFLFHKL